MRNLLLFLTLGAVALGQTPGISRSSHPVSATLIKIEGAAEGGFLAHVEVKVSGDYHIYGVVGESSWPTAFSVGNSDAIELAGQVVPSREPDLKLDPIVGDYTYFEGTVVFSVPLKPKEPLSDQTVAFDLLMDHMACTDRNCLAPMKLPIPISVEWGADGKVKPWEASAEPEGAAGVPEGDTETEEEPEAPLEAAPPKEVLAILDPSSPAPSGEVRLRIPLPAYSLLPGTRVETSNIILLSNQVEPLAGSAIVEGSEEAPLLAVTCIVDKNLQDGAELKVEGLLKAGAFTVSFGVTSVVRQGIWGFVWIAMGAALLALLTPCVFPMIPITVSFFTKHSEHSKHPPVIPAAVYCLGIVLSFTLIGLIFSLAFKTNAASISQSPIVLGGIGVLFVVFSLSLFGMFELQLPAAFSNMVGSAQQKGGLLSIWLLGLLFAVTSFACTAPFVGTLLATSLSSGQWVRPMIGMAAFSAVLAVPFFFLALFPSKLRSLPRAGGWLTQVKVVMGFIELAAALKFLGDMDGVLSLGVFTRSFILSAWIVLFALTGVYLLGAFRMPHDSPREGTPVVALLLAIFFLSFAAYLFRGVGGDPLAPGVDVYLPKELHERSPIGRREALLKEIKSLGGMSSGGGETGRVGMSELFKNDYAGARAEAERLKVPIFIDFTGYS